MDLSKLSEEQKKEHYERVCASIGLDPELGLLEYIWLDSGDGGRKLVLYALRGATDTLRSQRGISVTKLTREVGEGYISYMAEGIDQNGRSEISVGAAAIKDMFGKQLEMAIMTAQTRALRRLTLQFVGTGILDESEVQGPFTDINRSTTPLSSLATLPAPIQPAAAPNTAAGKDITTTGGDITSAGVEGQDWWGVSEARRASILASCITWTAGTDITSTGFINGFEATPEQIKANNLKPSMVAPAPFSGGSIIPEAVEQITETSQPIPEKKRRPGRKKSEIVMDAATEAEPAPQEPVIYIPTAAPIEPPVESPVVETPLPEIAVAVNPDMPTDEEVKAFKAELTQYTERNGIINKGGLTENVFGKIRLYTMSLFPSAEVLPSKAIRLTKTQWRTLLETFKQVVTEAGPVGLVRVIEGTNK